MSALDVTNLGALLVRVHERGLRLVNAHLEAPDMPPCDPWSEGVLAWMWHHCACDLSLLAYYRCGGDFDSIQPRAELLELARTTFLASHNVYRANGAVSPQAAAAMLGCGVERLRALEAAGDVRTVRRGGARWVPLDEVARLREPVTMTLDEVDALLARCAEMR